MTESNHDLDSLLPYFVYHREPLATGFVRESSVECVCCCVARGFIYVGPVFATRDDLVERICPWCIASGAAAENYGASFTDAESEANENVPRETVEAIRCRTPGFYSWQHPRWLYHCDDGAVFLGVVGAPELASYPDAVSMLMHENDVYGWTEEQSRRYVASLDKDGEASACLFRCRHCFRYLAYSDTA